MLIKSLCAAAALLTVVVVSQGDADYGTHDLATACVHKKSEHPTLLISTLDGKLTAVTLTENLPLQWEHNLDSPLLSTTMTPQENVHFIPFLDGTSYYYNTTTKNIQKNPNIDEMLNFKPSPDQANRIIGGKTTGTIGIEPHTGKTLYSCDMDDCKKFNDSKIQEEAVLAVNVERRTCRVVDLKDGSERWNLTVANVDMQYIGSKHGASCLPPDLGVQLFFNPALYEVEVMLGDNSISVLKMQSPLVSAWVLNNEFLQPINIFNTDSRDQPVFIGEWNNIHYGQTVPLDYPHLGLENILERSKKEATGLVAHYQPTLIQHQDNSKSTALIAAPINFPVGMVGYWNTTAPDTPVEEEGEEEEEPEKPTMFDMAIWYPWEMFISTLLMGVFVAYFIYRITMRKRKPNLVSEGTNPDVHMHEESVSTTSLQFSPRSANGHMEFEFPTVLNFVSRFDEDFEFIQEIGKGGFGRVLEAKHKLSDQNYAIKIIKLPVKEESQKKVQREVQALAKLEHPHILRYYSSWEETPPMGWMRQRRYTSTSAESFDSGTSTSPAFLRSPRTPSKVTSTSFFSESSTPNDNSLTFDNTDTSGGIVFKNETFNNSISAEFNHRRSPSFDSDTKSTEDDSMIIFRDQSQSTQTSQIDRLNSKRSNLVLPLHRKMIDRTTSSNVSDSVRISVADTPERERSVTFSGWDEGSEKKSMVIDMSDDGIDIGQSKDQTEDSAILSNHPGKQSYLYIQMEICHPDSLKNWLNLNDDRSGVMAIFKQIISAVEFIHSQNTIHRDIKPSNILFAMDGKVKVADFGLATVMGNANPGSVNNSVAEYKGPSMTHNLGTTLYMSPELEQESKEYDFKVDIYALGVVFFELLTVFNTAMERVDLIMELKKQKLPLSIDTNHPRYKPILLSMVDPDPKKRPTAPELALMIQNEV